MSKYLYSTDMTKYLNKLTGVAVDELQRAKRAAGLSNIQVAGALGLNRQTVGTRFQNKNMTLDEFIKTAMLSDERPSDILKRAEVHATLASQKGEK